MLSGSWYSYRCRGFLRALNSVLLDQFVDPGEAIGTLQIHYKFMSMAALHSGFYFESNKVKHYVCFH